MRIIIIGGGAAGFFAALAAKESAPDAEVVILEKSGRFLSKVRISGGGRCNVTHHCFEPRQLIQNYPRGSKELLGPFHTFQPQDTIDWFAARGVELKTEGDGRMFPITDRSQTVIDCLMEEADRLGVGRRTLQRVEAVERTGDQFSLHFSSGETVIADRLLLATGSSKQGYAFAAALGHTVEPPVPSLFTFNIPHFPLSDLSGISVPQAALSYAGSRLRQEGPLLITHWGFSGPAALKLSAWGARELYEREYEVELQINWLPGRSRQEIDERLADGSIRELSLPKRLWRRLVERSGIDPLQPLRQAGKQARKRLAQTLLEDRYAVSGKTTNKEEFVTCGGVRLAEVHFKRMESRCCPGLFFAGEVLDIDGVTGGFNFQNAWTTGFIAGSSASTPL